MLSLTDKRNTKYKALSGGQKQRLSIALALVGNPTIAILDELTTGLDPQARRDTWSLIERVRDRGVTILLVTHFMDEAERLSDRIAVIAGGRVAALDTPARLIAQSSAGQRVRFRLEQPLDKGVLTSLSDVTDVEITGDRWLVTGTGQLLSRGARQAARGESVLAPSVTQHLMGRVRRSGAGALTDRERQVLELVANGMSNRDVASALFIGEASIKTHLQHIYDKLGVRDRAAAEAEGYRRRLLS
ncbi:LuxR C-terminal-related transcriptional regulator [Cellulomonas wangsupingiae]|uniref:LuxR C-terminal-related transcriptional regulator n=1 Tax=Cellulomonas wangsupingiae TaxID=2968085 RepID=UPI00202F1F04|nr:LuxR C-terminal-related transcriptional regulator [Cellulomonas wangsupingiae]